MYNYLYNLLGGVSIFIVIFFVLLPLIISIAILVWLHNISLNTHKIYMLLQDMHPEELLDKNGNEITDDDLQPLKGVFIGGNTRLFARLKKHFPNFIFIGTEEKSFDESIVNGKDIVVIYPEEMSNELKSFTFDMLEKNKINRVIIDGEDTLNDIIKKIVDTTI